MDLQSAIFRRYLLLGFAIELAIVPIRGYFGGWGYAGIAVFILYFLAYLYFSNRDLHEIRRLTIAFLIPAVLLNIAPRIFMSNAVASLSELPAHFLGILAGYLFYRWQGQNILKYSSFILLYGISLYLCTVGLQYWLFDPSSGIYSAFNR